MRDNDEIEKKIEELLNNFYRRRINTLNNLELMKALKKKNPYLFKAIGTEKASEIVENMLLAYMSSSDEGIFGDAFFEPLAVFVSDGDPAPSSGVDIVIQDEKKYTAIAVKSGINVFNSQSKKKQELDFNALRSRMNKLQLIFDPIIGYGYGRKNQRKETTSAIRELAGQAFWHEITGDPNFYLKIIKLMKDLPLKHAIEYKEAWDHAVNRFTRDFAEQFCDKDGAIVWEKIVEYNSSSTPPMKGKRKKKME